MPNIRAAIKSLRQDKKKHSRNKSVKTELRTLVKNARSLIKEGDLPEVGKVLVQLESKLDKAAKNNVIKKKNAARRISRLKKAAFEAESAAK